MNRNRLFRAAYGAAILATALTPLKIEAKTRAWSSNCGSSTPSRMLG